MEAVARVEEVAVEPVAAGAPSTGFERLRAAAEFVRGQMFDILVSVKNIQAITGSADDPAVKAQLKQELDAFTRNRDQVDGQIRRMIELVQSDAKVGQWGAGKVALIEDLWERVKAGWPPTESAPDTASRRAQATVPNIHEVIYQIGIVTIPTSLKGHLRNQRVGKKLSFDAFFGDELPTEELRARMFAYLESQAGAFAGLFGEKDRVIYAVSPKPRRVIGSYVAIVVAALLPFLFFVINKFVGLEALLGKNPNKNEVGDLATYAVLVLVGAIVHVGVVAFRDTRGETSLTAADRMLWLHAREWPIALHFLALWGAMYATWWWGGDIGRWSWFLLGYSADSFFDAILGRFDKAADTGVAALKKRLSG